MILLAFVVFADPFFFLHFITDPFGLIFAEGKLRRDFARVCFFC